MSERKVSTDALETLGTIIDETQRRDAIHLAVLPALAKHALLRGQGITVTNGIAEGDANGLCVVDPFLQQEIVRGGERFWAILRPRLVQSLRHVWSHPAFEDEAGTHADQPEVVTDFIRSQKWIREYAATVPLTYEILMGGARDWLAAKRDGEYGEYLCFGGLLEGEVVPEEFWAHYEVVAGETVAKEHRGSFFTCSC